MSATTASIVITNHDYGRYVGDAVRSALAQRGSAGDAGRDGAKIDVEVIVVDDGSTDRSLDVLAEFGDDIVVIAQPNGGQAAAFNSGFAATSGDIVVFLDADDLLDVGLIARLVDVFADTTVGRVQFPLHTIDERGDRLGELVPPGGRGLATGDLVHELMRFPDDLAWQPTSGNAFRRRVLDAILPMPTEGYRICADYYTSNLSALHGEVRALDHPGGSYRVHGENAHHRATWTLDAIRANIVRTAETHGHLLCAATAADVPGAPSHADGFRSVTDLAHRLVSIRLAPDEHPLAGDRRLGLIRRGWSAALGRSDQPRRRRAAIAVWFLVAGLAPTRLVPIAARPFIRIDPGWN